MLAASKAGDRLNIGYVHGKSKSIAKVSLQERPRETSEEFDILYDAVDIDGHIAAHHLYKAERQGQISAGGDDGRVGLLFD